MGLPVDTSRSHVPPANSPPERFAARGADRTRRPRASQSAAPDPTYRSGLRSTFNPVTVTVSLPTDTSLERSSGNRASFGRGYFRTTCQESLYRRCWSCLTWCSQ